MKRSYGEFGTRLVETKARRQLLTEASRLALMSISMAAALGVSLSAPAHAITANPVQTSTSVGDLTNRLDGFASAMR
jgi:hypothetical protein